MIALWAGALLVGTPAASAADAWRPVPTSCVGSTDVGGTCTEAEDASGLWQVALSPDGEHVYGSTWDTERVLLFDRDPATGALTPRDGASVPSVPVPRDIEVSADGEHVYVTGSGGGLAILARAADTGLLTAAGCVNDTGIDGCVNARGLTMATEIVLAPGGAQLYLFMARGRDPHVRRRPGHRSAHAEGRRRRLPALHADREEEAEAAATSPRRAGSRARRP